MFKEDEMEKYGSGHPPEEITSRANPRIKAAAALLKSNERKKTGRFLTEGARLCGDAVKSGVTVEEFFSTDGAKEKYSDVFALVSGAAKRTFIISPDVAEKLSDTRSTQEMFCVCPDSASLTESDIKADGFYVMTENVQNPDNLGAVVRSAEALGADGLIVFSGCDIRSPKALRASMGGLLRFPVIKTSDCASLIEWAKKNGMKIFATVASGDAADISKADKSGGCICIIGNEGAGISAETLALCTHKITIPMLGKAESLNAAAAAAITVWEFMKERGKKANVAN